MKSLLVVFAALIAVSTAGIIKKDVPFKNPCFTFGMTGDGKVYQRLCEDKNQRFFPMSPANRDQITDGTNFNLYTRSNRNVAQKVIPGDASTLGNFDPTKNTLFVTHGYTESGSVQWINDFKDAVLNREDFNVFIVDWGDLSGPLYTTAVQNTRPVGEYIGQLQTYLDSLGCPFSRQHLCGFSLGGQIVGFAGASVGGQTARVSGIDPAYPLYENSDETGHLDPSDGVFVDVIHTNSGKFTNGALSFPFAVGQIDFAPNGGHRQAGCHDLFESVFDIAQACSHLRCPQLYIETINDPNALPGYSCADYNTYEQGSCTQCPANGCPKAGYNADPSYSGIFWLATRSDSPYTGAQLFITTNFARAQTSTLGHVLLTLISAAGGDTLEVTNEDDVIDSGVTIYTAAAILPSFSNFQSAEVQYKQDDKVHSESVQIDKIEVWDPRTDQRICFPAVTLTDGDNPTAVSPVTC